MAHARAAIGKAAYPTNIRSGRHTLIADEPTTAGGQDAGPNPTALLAAALASCTAITLRMYADRKQWPLEAVNVSVNVKRAEDKSTSIERVLQLEGVLTDEQRARLADIAERTPVTLMIKSGSQLHTILAERVANQTQLPTETS